MVVRPRLQQAILMKDLANLRRLQIKNDQLSDFRQEKKAIKIVSLIYLGLFVLVLGAMVILEFPISNSQVFGMEGNMGTEVLTLLVCNVLLWIFPVLRIFSINRKINLLELECHILVEKTKHMSN
ncbi:MAG: hypothetical protein P8O16_12985 [Algoriphagus sp.]|uniref:hypothetical protein n=1 Tax=Algoriphagus sp. TaxID=1872435 RepID=UPI002626A88E|nr:hypothetical protein [Algoriphagus sp.]MDG1278190.1 hypothetical protein [Algoriphagus sp.]